MFFFFHKSKTQAESYLVCSTSRWASYLPDKIASTFNLLLGSVTKNGSSSFIPISVRLNVTSKLLQN
jgi:hypothetical protein